MANWQRRLDIRDVWDKAGKEMTVQELAAVIAKRLKALNPFGDEDIDNQRDEMVEGFQSFSDDKEGTKDEFDSLMSELYDWGDIALDSAWPPKKVCWIATAI